MGNVFPKKHEYGTLFRHRLIMSVRPKTLYQKKYFHVIHPAGSSPSIQSLAFR